jgi:hypothetical protein
MPKPYSGLEKFTFISYSHLDKKIVFPILDKLEGLSTRFWFDEGIEHGADWAAKIAKKIEESVCFLVFLSKNSLSESSFVRNEINFAAATKKSILSVLIDDVSPDGAVQLLIGRFQTISFSKAEPENKNFIDLLNKFANEVVKSLPDETKMQNEIPKEGEPHEYSLIYKKEDYSYFLRDQSICNGDVDLISVIRFNRKSSEQILLISFTFGASIITMADIHSIYLTGIPKSPDNSYIKPECLHFDMNVRPHFHRINPPLGTGNFSFMIHNPFTEDDRVELLSMEGTVYDKSINYPSPNIQKKDTQR